MTRARVLGVLIAAGGLSLAAAAYQAPQQQGPKVIQVDKVKDNLYVLKGGGGNTAVFITGNGVVVVDAKNPGWGQPILDKIKTLTDKPVTMLINTHTHGDHVSGNVEFPATVDVVAQENTKANMEKMPIFKEHGGNGMAKRTFKDRMTLLSGPDEIDLYYFGRGHTNGDAWVVFKGLRTVHAGDLFASKNLPLIDTNNGGSAVDYPDTLAKAHAGIKNVDTVINGHNDTTTTWADLQDYADFNKAFRTWAEGEMKAGKTPQQAAAEYTVAEPFKSKGYTGNVSPLFGGLAGNIQTLYNELQKK